ncbi:MAG TPA: transglutaminase family protein [Candidatus Binatia bacterium]|nr:transglutaminase family protein [Candidatus Binatia bacterium]
MTNDQFLADGRYCDWHDPAILSCAREVTQGLSAPIARAIALFQFVRDDVRYTFGPWGIPASDTLQRREGVCTNKANLLVALFRATGIPAAFGLLQVNPREYYGVVAPPYLKPFVSDRSLHVYAAARLEDVWVRCDPSTDREIATKTAHYCRQTRLIEWDGRQDALDFLQPQHVYADLGLRACIDDLLDKPARHAQPETLAAINDYVRFIRTSPPFASAEALIAHYARERGIAPGEPT